MASSSHMEVPPLMWMATSYICRVLYDFSISVDYFLLFLQNSDSFYRIRISTALSTFCTVFYPFYIQACIMYLFRDVDPLCTERNTSFLQVTIACVSLPSCILLINHLRNSRFQWVYRLLLWCNQIIGLRYKSCSVCRF